MAQLHVQVSPPFDPSVEVQVYCYTDKKKLDRTFTCQKGHPLNEAFHVLPGGYAVTFTWKEGWQNIAIGAGNWIAATMTNGEKEDLYFQVTGDGYTAATFSMLIR